MVVLDEINGSYGENAGTPFVNKNSRSVGLHLLTFRILESYPSKGILLDLSHVIQINGIIIVNFKGFSRNIFASLFFKSKQEHLSN